MDFQSVNRSPRILPGPHCRPRLPKIGLEIVRGQARRLVREVAGPVFLFGTAHDCDLVFGDPQFPEVYAYLFITEHGVSMRHLGIGPVTTVNSRSFQSTLLFDGDMLRMGSYEFHVRIEWDTGPDLYRRRRGKKSVADSISEPALRQVNELLCDVRGILSQNSDRDEKKNLDSPELPRDIISIHPRRIRAIG